MIEHCIAAFQSENREKLFRMYVTDTLKVIAENTSKSAVPGVGVVDYGAVLTKRWIELAEDIQPKSEEKEDPRTCSEIAHDMWQRIRG